MSDDIPYGYCHCGCGKLTTVSKYNDAYHGHVKGMPRPYCKGHNKHGKPAKASHIWRDKNRQLEKDYGTVEKE